MGNVTVNIINKPPESPVEGVGAKILVRSVDLERSVCRVCHGLDTRH
jgi:hypothetical protein